VNGTSQCGQAALRSLAEYTEFYDFKATSRSAPSAAVAAALPHVHWLTCDLSKESLTAVTKGIDKVFYVAPAAQNRAEIARNLAAALGTNNVQYVVHISVPGAQYRAITFANQFRDAEEALEATGVAVTHLRAGGFMENILQVAGPIKSQSTLYQSIGDASMALVAVADIGRAAAKLLTRLLTQMGADALTVEVTGPQSLSGVAMAETLSRIVGYRIQFISPPIADTVAQLKSYGVEEWFADALGEFYGIIQKGFAAGVSPDGSKLIGELTSFDKWCQENKAAFI